MTAVAGVSKGQTDMSYKGVLQTFTKLTMRHQREDLCCYEDVLHNARRPSQINLMYSEPFLPG